MAEHWRRVYWEAPGIFEAFARAEDPEGRVAGALRLAATLDGRTVLEIGAGTGKLARRLSTACAAWIALEPERALLSRMMHGPSRLQALGQRLPLKTHSVQRVVAAWVLGYLGRSTVAEILAEVDRVLESGSGAGIWAIENAGSGEFQALRGFQAFEPGTRRLMDEFGFQLVESVPIQLAFPSSQEAERILRALCGDSVGEALARTPRKELGHAAVLLYRPKGL